MSAAQVQSRKQEKRYEIYTQAEENPKMKEVFDILLKAGYFRIRIPSFQTFDKILGSLTWCIACSNFDIDIEYDDDMNLGQKIALSEKICNVLHAMECPYDLQPFQIRGLDFDKILPIVNWLIKFVYETREERWDFNTSMSNFLGKKTYESFQERQRNEEKTIKETAKQIASVDKRLTKNVSTKALPLCDPIRIYSALIEYGDITANKTYNKLCGVVSGKIDLEAELSKQKKTGGSAAAKKNDAKNKKKKGEEFDVGSFLFYGGAGQSSKAEVQSAEINAMIAQQTRVLQDGSASAGMSAAMRGAVGAVAGMVGSQNALGGGVMQMQSGNIQEAAAVQIKQATTVKKGQLAQMNAQQFTQQQMQMPLQSVQEQQVGFAADGKNAQTAFAISQQSQQSASQAEMKTEVAAEDLHIDDTQFRRVERRQSVVGANLMELIAGNQEEIKETLANSEQDQSAEDENAINGAQVELENIIAKEREFHAGQFQALEKKVAVIEKKLEEESEELYSLQEQETGAGDYLAQHSQLSQEQSTLKQQLEKRLAAAKLKNKETTSEAETLLAKRNALKDKRVNLKKDIKAEMTEKEELKQKVIKEQAILAESQQTDESSQALYQKKKEKYDKKMEEFTKVNQNIAVLSRKVENFPSAAEIAQYQLRLLELYESISSESEKEKDNYIKYNNFQDVKGQIASFVDLMKTFKENYLVHKKSKSGREKFIQDLTAAYKGLEVNHAKTLELLGKQKTSREGKLEELNKLKAIERDYFKLLKDLRLELEINDTLYSRG